MLLLNLREGSAWKVPPGAREWGERRWEAAGSGEMLLGKALAPLDKH